MVTPSTRTAKQCYRLRHEGFVFCAMRRARRRRWCRSQRSQKSFFPRRNRSVSMTSTVKFKSFWLFLVATVFATQPALASPWVYHIVRLEAGSKRDILTSRQYQTMQQAQAAAEKVVARYNRTASPGLAYTYSLTDLANR